MKRIALLLLPLTLSGCVGMLTSAAVDVVTLPVKVVSASVDAVTTSQSERDEKLGRKMRKQEEERQKLMRAQEKRCRKNKPLPTDDCSGYLPG
jgi:antitoxin component of RelBE/YafQ-DinJ toxin-antitoxin module